MKVCSVYFERDLIDEMISVVRKCLLWTKRSHISACVVHPSSAPSAVSYDFDRPPIVLVHGPFGTGKTHVLCATLRALVNAMKNAR